MFQRTDVKKNFTTLGYISIRNENPFSQGMNGFQISPRMQELITYAGQLDCYERCNEVIKQFLDVEVSHAQAHRVTDTYGEELGKSRVVERTKRMKLSGQRWSKRGAQNMLNLRVTYMNDQWSKVIQLTKTNFKAAA